jgi:uncharacterized membrane protein
MSFRADWLGSCTVGELKSTFVVFPWLGIVLVAYGCSSAARATTTDAQSLSEERFFRRQEFLRK